jgi:PAS domain S-box-containing protein
VIARDVTDREVLEWRLRHQASLVESVSDALFSAGLDHAVRTWNPAAQRLLGWTGEQMIGRSWTVAAPFAPESGTVTEMFDTLLVEGAWRGDGVQRDRDGNPIAVSMSANLATDPNGERYAIYSVRDERQLRQLESELRHAQKMEAVGRLASGIAHDFNNLLMGIIGCADIALSELDHPGAVATFLDEIKRAASSGAGITRQLLAFSRRREPDPTPFELGEAVAASAEMLRRLVGEDMPFEISGAGGALWVDADRGQIEQVLMNLVVNARDAMPGGGKLTIELTREELSSPLGRLAAGPCVVLAVSDTGCGMDEATRERLFEPFFTTKPAGEGTGLGLSTVYGIVKRAGGHIGVRTEPGRGSTFTIRLPAIAAPPDRDASDLAISAVAGSGRIALVVEDEALVRLTCAHYLGELGFEVLEAGDAARAIELAGERREAIDLLITDVVLPGGSGDQIVSEISALCPGVAAVFMSAHPPAELARAGYVAADRPALHKPFSRDELERAVTEALGLVR